MKKFIIKHSLKLLVIFLFIVTVLLVYSYRWVFNQPFNYHYYKHFYDHSQWMIPSSPRIMGDGELYQYTASELINGAHPFEYNPGHVEQVTHENDDVHGMKLHEIRNEIKPVLPDWNEILTPQVCEWVARDYADINKLAGYHDS